MRHLSNYPPLTDKKHCMYTNPFNQRTSAILSRSLRLPTGGLKGKTAPGEAHPYLVPFYVEIIYGLK